MAANTLVAAAGPGVGDGSGVVTVLLTCGILRLIPRRRRAARLVGVARSRFRSVRYDLEASVAVARVVENAGGAITPELLAGALGYSGTNNGTYLTRLANAKLFGVVGGRGTRVEITDRGRRILAAEGAVASGARREAFMAVPLFRTVLESLPPGAFGGRTELADRLVEEFGEPGDKAPVAAGKFLDSALQAGLIHLRRDGKYEVRRLPEKFTVVDNLRPVTRLAAVVKSRRTQSSGRPTLFGRARGGDVDENQMWLDEGPQSDTKGAGHASRGRRLGVIAAAVACILVVAVPISVALSGSSRPTAQAPKHHHAGGKATTLGNGPAEHEVLGALSATTDSNTFDFDYNLSTTAPTDPTPTTTTTTVCQTVTELPSPLPSGVATSNSEGMGTIESGGASGGGAIVSSGGGSVTPTTSSGLSNTAKKAAKALKEEARAGSVNTVCRGAQVVNPGTPVTGNGISNVNPKATLIDATVGSNANSGLLVSIREDGTTLYEDLGSLETSLAPPANMADASGQPIGGFAGITESTIGTREGAIAMLGMASPTGYLDLYQQDIDGASQTGTGTVDGVPVTVYTVAVDPTELVNDPDITSEESTTAAAAIQLLNAQSYTGTTDEVSIDASGFIREVKSVAHFSDGGTVVLDVTLSNFGCAGTVLMPGQQGPADPPSGCTSPDTGVAPTTTTTLPAVTQSQGETALTVPTTVAPPTTVPATIPPTTTTPDTSESSTTTTTTPTTTTTSTG
jgi:hypothetical protein